MNIKEKMRNGLGSPTKQCSLPSSYISYSRMIGSGNRHGVNNNLEIPSNTSFRADMSLLGM